MCVHITTLSRWILINRYADLLCLAGRSSQSSGSRTISLWMMALSSCRHLMSRISCSKRVASSVVTCAEEMLQGSSLSPYELNLYEGNMYAFIFCMIYIHIPVDSPGKASNLAMGRASPCCDVIICLLYSITKASHYNDVTMSTMASQITSLTIVYSTVYSGEDQRKH